MKILFTFILNLFVFVVSASAEVENRIYNGNLSFDSRWMVSLSEKGQSAFKGHFCGAALIDPEWVVTAAHCAEFFKNDPTKLQIHYGSSDLESGVLVDVDGIIVHEDYDDVTNSNDIALIHLKEALDIKPLSLFPGDEQLLPGTSATVYGWGLTEDKNLPLAPVQYLREVAVVVQTESICKKALKSDFDVNSMLCAGILSSGTGKTDGKDSCNGDSGGPLVTDIGGEQQLIGLVSWGRECASWESYGVYTNIPKIKDWLNRPRIIPSYVIGKPLVHGLTAIGHRLSCKANRIAGSAPTAIKYRWFRADNNKVISKSHRILLKPSMYRSKLICEMELLSEKAATYAYSRPTSRISLVKNRAHQ